MKPLTTFSQDPAERLDYLFDFAPLLAPDGPDTINATVFSCEREEAGGTPLTLTPILETGDRVSVWVSGGVTDEVWFVFATVTTAGDRTWKRSIKIKIKRN